MCDVYIESCTRVSLTLSVLKKASDSIFKNLAHSLHRGLGDHHVSLFNNSVDVNRLIHRRHLRCVRHFRRNQQCKMQPVRTLRSIPIRHLQRREWEYPQRRPGDSYRWIGPTLAWLRGLMVRTGTDRKYDTPNEPRYHHLCCRLVRCHGVIVLQSQYRLQLRVYAVKGGGGSPRDLWTYGLGQCTVTQRSIAAAHKHGISFLLRSLPHWEHSHSTLKSTTGTVIYGLIRWDLLEF